MKIFVTGGAGFIGSHVVASLIANGYDVTVYDNLSTGYLEFVDERSNFIQGDLMDFDKLKNAIRGHDGVIHLAAESIIKFSIENPRNTFEKNINGSLNLLEAMRLNAINNIIYSSSAAVYGDTNDKTVKEDDLKEPLQPYGASKLAVELLLSAYYHTFGINSTSLRYFCVYGPRDMQLPVTRAVPGWFKSILQNKEIELYWKGSQVRDYIYVEDVANAHLLALKNCKGFNVYNIGSGKGNTMLEILGAVFKAAGKKIKVKDCGERAGDPHYLVAEISKIDKELKWKPTTNLKDGMKKTFEFYRAKY